MLNIIERESMGRNRDMEALIFSSLHPPITVKIRVWERGGGRENSKERYAVDGRPGNPRTGKKSRFVIDVSLFFI